MSNLSPINLKKDSNPSLQGESPILHPFIQPNLLNVHFLLECLCQLKYRGIGGLQLLLAK